MNTYKDAAPVAVKAQPCQKAAHSCIDQLDALNESIAKARAMIHMTFGESGDNFRGFNREFQDNYLWALSDHIETASKHLAQLQDELTGTRGGVDGS